jgi:putative hydrolase of the HAD superfamily
MNKTFIFDYDDTLAPNQHYYCYAQLKFVQYVLDKLRYKSPDVQSIINTEVEIDVEHVKKYGFAKERFPNSFVEALKKIFDSRKYPYGKKERDEEYDIGMTAFDIQSGLTTGAEDVLNFLTQEKDELILYTKGDKSIQQKKLDINHLKKWFSQDKTYIVSEKNSSDLENIVGDRNKDQTFKVGNSIRSDVNPALEAGIKVIYIPCETWAYERDHNGVDLSNPRLFKFENIGEIISNYPRL